MPSASLARRRRSRLTDNKGANRLASARRDEKKTRKRQQNCPVRFRRIGFGDGLLVPREESFPLALPERADERAKTGRPKPLDDRVRAGERMKIGRAPDVNVGRESAQQAEIPLG